MVQPTRTCNVLIVGNSGVGKSTFVQVLVDEAFIAPRKYTSTHGEPRFFSHIVRGAHGYYLLNMVDTPNLKDPETEKEQTVQQCIYKCVEHNVTALNCVLVCVQANREFGPEDAAAFEEIQHFLGPESSKIAAILFTHTENMTPDKREEMVTCLRGSELCGPLFRYCQLGHVFTGALDDSNTAVHAIFKPEVLAMRLKVLEFLEQCTDRAQYTPKELETVVEHQGEAARKFIAKSHRKCHVM